MDYKEKLTGFSNHDLTLFQRVQPGSGGIKEGEGIGAIGRAQFGDISEENEGNEGSESNELFDQ